jgi:predicted acyltransferase
MSIAHPISSAAAPESAPLPVPLEPRAARFAALDVFRGLTMIGMLLVNNPGDAAAAYPQLRHSVWHGCTLADLVFPFFLFVVGITTHLSLRSRTDRGEDDAAVRRQIVRRGALLFVIGLMLNWFPFYQFGTIEGHQRPTAVDHFAARLLDLRFLGVLQRIGTVYIVAAFLTWRAPTKRVVVITAALLIGYWMALTLLPVPGEGAIGLSLLDDPGRTLSARLDRAALDWSPWGLGNHLWESSKVYDPEGLLSTFPAIATTTIGVLVGRWLGGPRPLGQRLNGLFASGILMVMAGLLWGAVFPINKSLWTSSYVLYTAGVGCTTLATIAWLIDVKHYRRWTTPFIVFGVNPILAYVGAELTAVLFDSTIKFRVAGQLKSLHQLTYEALASWLPPNAASLVYSLAFVGLWYMLLLALYRRGVVLKI